MGHWFSSFFFLIIIVGLFLNKTKLKDRFDLIKFHKIIGKVFVVYMSIYIIIDYIIDRESSILVVLPSLIGIYFTGEYKSKIKLKYAHSLFVVLFLITLLMHVLF